ncbi:universal stress protein [Desulfovibrio sulfodismutans]|uniref:Universal stress protein n=1 Tax=Desulfolutivibrio sulfodismutans TaxID=63561 RepID=A0A7K3NPY5_9BACT|nr:universal stress protein [Desulfolutivibrio sulfodismutans]NDY58244.1 universal stress protein [Desulfolutivibrio sulfodismutans]QLA13084.1 universal stress protein [Desulfolutivibrio sulfodismutans DSM 3696]
MLPIIRRILLATDLSESSRQALRYAVSEAERHHASLTILHVAPDVVEMMSEESGFDIEGHFDAASWNEFNEKNTSRALERARAKVAEAAKECVTDSPNCPAANARIKIAMGDPAGRILEELAAGGYDLVVMGTHGHNSFMDMLLGGVAQKVLRHSVKPILFVRETVAEQEA